jgi:hypothetical protein
LPKTNVMRTILFLLIVAAFALGVVKLFLLRFEAGDVYPAYSSLRSDPLGSRVFYSSLENISSARVSRNFLPLQNLEFKQKTAFFYIGTAAFDSQSLSLEWLKIFERLTNKGGRLVLSFLPVEKKPANWRMQKCFLPGGDLKDKDKTPQGAPPKDSPNPAENHQTNSAAKNDDHQPETPPVRRFPDKSGNCVSIKDQWGLTFAFAERPPDRAVNVTNDLAPEHIKNLPQKISWHTALYFDELEDTWREIYAADGRPVVIERPFGRGSLVLSADSFFLSNEALWSERHPALLAWLLADSANIVFDETHFGILRHPGVLDLIQKYRFHWFILTVGILVILFIWKNSISFVPPPNTTRSQPGKDVISDRDSTQGLISLLRRNIPTGRLLQTCAGEWERSVQPEKWFQSDRLMQIKLVLQKIETQSPKSIDPVSGYRRISKIISKGTRYE